MSAPALAALQAAIQKDVLTNGQDALERLSVPEGADKAERLAVYQYAYRARLTDILATDYDMLWTFLGDEVFHDLAQRYIAACPSEHYNARWFGAQLPDYLRRDPVLRDHHIAADLAALEWAIGEAFDAKNAPVAGMDDLAKVAPDQVATTVFVLHPACRLLKPTTNAHDIFVALKANETPPAPTPLPEESGELVWRIGETSHYKPLSSEETALLELLQNGADFALLCETAAFMADPETAAARVAGHITSWLQQAVISRIVSP